MMDPPRQTDVPPPINNWEPPELHRLDAYEFQGLCRDLLYEDEIVTTCDIYGVQGQRQHGIDLIAPRQLGEGVDVGQCRCYRVYQPRHIKQASDEFFEHWDHWRDKGVRRFILLVACDLSTTQRRNEVLRQRDRFGKYEIQYEAWDASMIVRKMQGHPPIVWRYLQSWYSHLCGYLTTPASPPVQQHAELFDPLAAALAIRVSGTASSELDRMRDASKEGRKLVARDWIASLKADGVRWAALEPAVRVDVLRFEAALAIDLDDDPDTAERLADEADSLANDQGDTRLRAMIALKKYGSNKALEILDGDLSREALNLVAALLITSQKIVEGLEALDAAASIEKNAETHRLRAIAKIIERDIPAAQLEIARSLEIEPHWETSLFVQGVTKYYQGLTPTCIPDQLVLWPEPVGWHLIKRDDKSVWPYARVPLGFWILLEWHRVATMIAKYLKVGALHAWPVISSGRSRRPTTVPSYLRRTAPTTKRSLGVLRGTIRSI